MPVELFREVDVGYDTPLTYGGWKQSQALGAYIAQLLLLPGNPDRRKKRIVIHSSPFARCVQTSIGIAAGIAQVVPPAHGVNNNESIAPVTSSIASPYSRITLKLDPWLGEWMTEEYFGHWDAAHLRSSDIVARARALLTLVSEAEGIRMDPKIISSSQVLVSATAKEVPAIDAMKIQPLVSARGTAYVAPKPNHAVLATDAIPKGYVAHARDRCLDFDQTWVGLRDGGDYGEDWAVFHRRIGAGLEALLQWFLVHRYDSALVSHSGNESTKSSKPETKIAVGSENVKDTSKRLSDMSLESISEDQRPDFEDNDEELIVILVTHAGGCNKLLHFFTHKPVLIDFPQSCLTLAIKNPDFEGAGDLETLSKQYKVVMQASTDHLNPTAKFKTIKDLASANIEVTRHSRSTSRSSRRTTLTSIASVNTGPPTGLWGQTRSPDSKTAAPSVSTLWGHGRASVSESGSQSATATTFASSQTQPSTLNQQNNQGRENSQNPRRTQESQSGLWRPGGQLMRRATSKE